MTDETKVEPIPTAADTQAGAPRAADHGGERGRQRGGRRRGQGQHRVGSALGSEPDVGRSPRSAQHVVRCEAHVEGLQSRTRVTRHYRFVRPQAGDVAR